MIAILDSSGTMVVEYTYDTWGKPLTTTGSMANTLGQHNPLRYRGYVYDRETGLYYLQSRYYNPEWGRFINADSQLATGDFTGLNLFAYCGNNPVNRTDPTGDAWWHWAIAAVVVAAAAVSVVATCGGSLALAATSVGLVANGVAAGTAATTIAASAFVGSATAFAGAAIIAAGSSSSAQEFADKGTWGTVVGTVLGGGLGALDGYNMYRTQSAQYENAYNYSGGKTEKYTQKRGWTDQSIRHTIHNGRQGITENRAGNPCTAYRYPGSDNQYVVVNSSTRSIVQVSDLFDSNWIVDGRIFWG